MSWDEHLFAKASRWLKKQSSKKTAPKGGAAYFADLAPRLELLASALAEESVELRDASEIASPLINFLTLPRVIDIYPESPQNEAVYFFRLLQHHVAIQKKLCLAPLLEGSIEKTWALSLEHYQQVVAFVSQDFPSFWETWHDLDWQNLVFKDRGLPNLAVPQSAKHLVGILPRARRRVALKVNDELSEGTDAPPSDKPASEVELKTSYEAKLVKLNRETENPLTHVFEKVLTADEYTGGNKAQDLSDQVADHQEALSEVTLGHVMRSTEASASVATVNTAGVETVSGEPQTASAKYSYPEWFQNERRYRENWCRLDEFVVPEGDNAFLSLTHTQASTAREIQNRLEYLFNQEVWRNRQKQGPELDVDALVHHRATLKSDGVVNQRIYIDRKRFEHDLALLLLVDASMSTDAYAHNRRIIEVIRDTVLILASGLRDLDELFSVAIFRSATRHHCDYGLIKDFSEPWSLSLSRLANLQPQGHTRIGVALRHATQVLVSRKARKRAIFLISDARPSDIDHYEGAHGRADVKEAVLEAMSRRIYFHAFAVSADKTRHLNEVFGLGQFSRIEDEKSLSEGIGQAFAAFLRA